MKFRFIGIQSQGADGHTIMGVRFRDREPSEVTDPAAISWLAGNPDYEAADDEAELVTTPKTKPRKQESASDMTVDELEAELGDDLDGVKGTGKGGNVVKADLVKAVEKKRG